MKIVIAPDSFKESLSGKIAFDAIERGLKKAVINPRFITALNLFFIPASFFILFSNSPNHFAWITNCH